MKKFSLTLASVIAFVLIATSCTLPSNMPFVPQEPQPGGLPPQDMQPGPLLPGQPQPEPPQPGQPQPGPLQPGQPQPEPLQPEPPQPEPPQPEQPQPQPQPTQSAPTKSSPTKKSSPNPTATIIMLQAVLAKLDLAITNIYPASSGHIMVTVKNTGNQNVSGSYKVTCSGSYTDSGGNHALSLTAQYATVNLTAGQKADYDTGYSRNPSITEMWVSCKITPPQGDADSSNDSMGMTKVK